MTWLFLAAFVIGTVYLVLLFLAEWFSRSDKLPFGCPRCHYGGDEDLVGQSRPWWRGVRGGHVQCRVCRTHFREHPNGMLVEDHER